jgi:hypothetical protein
MLLSPPATPGPRRRIDLSNAGTPLPKARRIDLAGTGSPLTTPTASTTAAAPCAAGCVPEAECARRVAAAKQLGAMPDGQRKYYERLDAMEAQFSPEDWQAYEAELRSPCPNGRDPQTGECRPKAGCPEGQIRDRTTRECRPKTPKRSGCPPGQIRDRKSKQCRPKTPKRSGCPPGQIRDRKSKQCRAKRSKSVKLSPAPDPTLVRA